MYAEKHTIPVTTIADGSATVYSPRITGRIINVIYNKTDFADTADFTITLEGSGQGLWTEANVTASKTVAPRQPTHDQIGAASLYAAAGEPVEDHIYAANDRVKIVIAQGGDTKSGSFDIVVS